jgi:tRNA-splicing ligase RtcB (3'-phosphate/5'-hydroxy nucleic acid ligase)
VLEGSSSLTISPVLGKKRVPVQFFTAPSSPLQSDHVAALVHLSELPGVAQVVALPDLHLKPNLETPSSLAVAMRDTLVLGLSSPSPNCGMSLAQTCLRLEDLNHSTLDRLFHNLAARMPLSSPEPVLSKEEVLDILQRGAQAAVEKYDLPPAVLNFMEQRGAALGSIADPEKVVLDAVPPALIDAGRWRFGQIGKGNHFLELQVVDKLHNHETAKAWGLEEGQVVVMYHADSGMLGAFVGRLYAHRQKNTWRGRLYEWQIKLPFHLFRGSPTRLFHRLASFVLPRRLAFIPAHSEEGRRAWVGLQAAANYAYANRLAVFSHLTEALRQVLGPDFATPTLLWDAPHNSIRPEKIAGEDLWVHRHNAARVIPPSHLSSESPFLQTGHPVLLPGLERTSSYLCSAGEGAAFSLLSADHGAGRTAQQLGRALPAGPSTRVYGYAGADPEIRPHISDDGLLEVLSVLKENDIAHPVASLRPIAVLKA